MPKIVFVNPPLLNKDVEHITPPLGPLCLAEIAEEAGWDWRLVDFDLPAHRPKQDEVEGFYVAAVSKILDRDPDVCAVTSMGVNSHVILEIASRIKRSAPKVVIIAGGVHFSSIHRKLLDDTNAIDCFVVGEGEAAFQRALVALETPRGQKSLPSVISGDIDGARFGHPFRAFERIDLEEYFRASGRRRVSYEGGRGCVFRCSFCYSPSFYSGGARDLDPERLVRDWARLEELRVEQVFLVQDNFTNFPEKAIRACELLSESGTSIQWNGYATLPQLTPSMIEALGRSGCKQIYIGVDAVSESQQEKFRKPFFRSVEPLLETLGRLENAGVKATCAFMLDLFEYSEIDVEAVFRTAVACSDIGTYVRINVLSRYPGTEIAPHCASLPKYSEARVRLLLDSPEVVCQNERAREHPELFPFHSTEVDESDWRARLAMVRDAQRVIWVFSDDLVRYTRDPAASLIDVIGDLVGAASSQAVRSHLDHNTGFSELY